MDFFSEWLRTRLGESGWPKKEGLFKQKQYHTEESVVMAMQDTVRIGLALGSSLPSDAKGIAITYKPIAPSTTRLDIDDWITERSSRGSIKWEALSDTRPHWLKFCSLTLEKNGEQDRVGVWTGSPDKYYVGSPDASNLFRNALALPVIAMLWAIVNPESALIAIDDYPGRDEELEQFGEISGPSSAWIEIARVSVAAYSNKFALPQYDDEETWGLRAAE